MRNHISNIDVSFLEEEGGIPSVLCLICSELTAPLETTKIPQLSKRKEVCLDPHLWSMYVLTRVINYPKEGCINLLLKTCGAVNPGQWFALCDKCFQTVKKAYILEREVANLQAKLESVKSGVNRKLKDTLREDCTTNNRNNGGVFDVRQHLRLYFENTLLLEPDPPVKIEIIEQDEYTDDFEYFNQNAYQDSDSDSSMPMLSIATATDEIKNDLNIPTPSTSSRLMSKNKRSLPKPKSKSSAKRRRLSQLAQQLNQDDLKPNEVNLESSLHGDESTLIPLPDRVSCSLCPAKFAHNRNLEHHLNLHKRHVDTSCPKCNFPCNTSKKLSRHLALNRCTFQGHGSNLPALAPGSREGNDKCHICNRIYPSKIQLDKHLYNHKHFRKFTCSQCKMPCADQRKLDIHIKIWHSSQRDGQSNELKCDICGYTTDYPYVFSRHQRVHEKGEFSCELCSFPTLTRISLQMHMKEKHGMRFKNPNGRRKKTSSSKVKTTSFSRKLHKEGVKEEVYQCHLCPSVFAKKPYLNQHIEHVHERNHVCPEPECSEEFSSNYFLKKHRHEEHGHGKTSAIPPICDKCGMQFAQMKILQQHRRKFHPDEDGDASFKYERTCSRCAIVCCNAAALKVHIKNEHPELYKFKCELCDSIYVNSGSLKIHVKSVHLKDRVECAKCGVKIKESSMSTHLRLHCKFRATENV